MRSAGTSGALISDAARAAALATHARATIEQMRVRSGFTAYLRAMVAIWPGETDDTPMVTATMRDLGRFAAGLWAIHLDATPGGLTLARLGAALEASGLSGVGRARGLLALLQAIGFIEPLPRGRDSRLRAYRPTDRMVEAFGVRLRRELVAAAAMDPAIAAALERVDEPALVRALLAAAGDVFLAAVQHQRAPGPTLDVVSHQFSGMKVLGCLVTAAARDDQPFPPVGPARIVIATVAETCGISRPQTRRILRAGADSGFFELRGEGEVMLTPLLAEHLEILGAAALVMLGDAARLALAATPEASASSSR